MAMPRAWLSMTKIGTTRAAMAIRAVSGRGESGNTENASK